MLTEPQLHIQRLSFASIVGSHGTVSEEDRIPSFDDSHFRSLDNEMDTSSSDAEEDEPPSERQGEESSSDSEAQQRYARPSERGGDSGFHRGTCRAGPVLDGAAAANSNARLEELSIEREQILNMIHPALQEGLTELRRDRDELLEATHHERAYRLADCRARTKSEISQVNKEFERKKSDLRLSILRRRHDIEKRLEIERMNTVSYRNRESGFLEELERNGLISLRLTPDEIKEDLPEFARLANAAILAKMVSNETVSESSFADE